MGKRETWQGNRRHGGETGDSGSGSPETAEEGPRNCRRCSETASLFIDGSRVAKVKVIRLRGENVVLPITFEI